MRLNIDRELKLFRPTQGSTDRVDRTKTGNIGKSRIDPLDRSRLIGLQTWSYVDPWPNEETNELKLNAMRKRVREVKIPFTSGNAIEDFKLLNFDTNKQF